jgi:hypothetical protein
MGANTKKEKNIYMGEQIKADEMGSACDNFGGKEWWFWWGKGVNSET